MDAILAVKAKVSGSGVVTGPAISVDRAKEILRSVVEDGNTNISGDELAALCRRYIKTMGE